MAVEGEWGLRIILSVVPIESTDPPQHEVTLYNEKWVFRTLREDLKPETLVRVGPRGELTVDGGDRIFPIWKNPPPGVASR